MLSRTEAMNLNKGRWSVPVLAALDERDGARVSELSRTLGVSRTSVMRTLEHLHRCGWARRNPGYGHPLRPEYLVTAGGQRIAGHARALRNRYRKLDLEAGDLPRWTLPVIFELAPSARRFSELLAKLAPATPRSLSLTIKGMMVSTLVSREVIEEFPPATRYALTVRGHGLAKAL